MRFKIQVVLSTLMLIYAGAGEVIAGHPFHFFLTYSSVIDSSCAPAWGNHLYSQKISSYSFSLVLNKQNFPAGFFEAHSSHQNDTQFEISSLQPSEKQLSEKQSGEKPLRVVTLREFIAKSKCLTPDCEVLTFPMTFKIPEKLRKAIREEEWQQRSQGVKFLQTSTLKSADSFPWSMVATLKQKEKSLYQTSTHYYVIPQGQLFYQQNPLKLKLQTLKTIPVSEIFDNSYGEELLRVGLNTQTSSLRRKTYSRLPSVNVNLLFGYFVSSLFARPALGGLDLQALIEGKDPTRSYFHHYLNFQETMLPITRTIRIFLSWSMGVHFDGVVLVRESQSQHQAFYLKPGQMGMIFGQVQIEDGVYTEFGPSKCGLLEKRQEKSLKIYSINYDLVPIDYDKDKRPEDSLSSLQKIADERMPAYQY